MLLIFIQENKRFNLKFSTKKRLPNTKIIRKIELNLIFENKRSKNLPNKV